MKQLEVNAYRSAQMAEPVEKARITKENFDFLSTFTLATLAGVLTAFGSILYTYGINDPNLSVSLAKLTGGLVFCLGLILIIVAGTE